MTSELGLLVRGGVLQPVVEILVVHDPGVGVDVELLLLEDHVAVLVLVEGLSQRHPRVALLGDVGRQEGVQVGRDPVALLTAEAGLLNGSSDLKAILNTYIFNDLQFACIKCLMVKA